MGCSDDVIPPFDAETGNLPPGVHAATWAEVVERFGWNERRRTLLGGLERAIRELWSFGCRRFYLDGSFVTTKEFPGDWDGWWEGEGVDIHRLITHDPLLWDDVPGRRNQKARFGGDLFPVKLGASSLDRLVFDQFRRDPVTGQAKGIISIDLETLP